MFTPIRSTHFVRRTLALSAILGASFAVMSAQPPATADQTASQPAATAITAPATASQQASALNLQIPAASSSSDAALSSSSADNEVAANVTHLNFINAMQYGGRRSYNRPRYRGGNTNPDGSNKWMFFAGAGFTQPIGDTYHLLTPSWGFQAGGGRQFSKHFAIPVQFDWDNFGFTRQNISNEAYIYTGDPNAADNQIDANSHIWSLTVDPTYTVYQGDSMGAYIVGGVGFYHKVANLTAPQTGVSCYYYCEQIEYQGNFAVYTSNAPGFNGGLGLTYKLSHFSNERLYGEVRYVFVDNSQRYGATVANAATYTGNDGYPANSNRTTDIPVKFGIRF